MDDELQRRWSEALRDKRCKVETCLAQRPDLIKRQYCGAHTTVVMWLDKQAELRKE